MTFGNKAMSVTERSFSGTDPEELAAILSTPTSRIKVAVQGKEPVAFRCNFVSAGQLVFADCAYGGDLVVRRDAPISQTTVFFPRQGTAVFDYASSSIESVRGQGAIIEGCPTNGLRLFGGREHLALFIENARISSTLSGLLDRTIHGNINIRPTLELSSGPGTALAYLVEQLHDGLRGGGPLQQSPLALVSLYDAVIYLLLESCLHRYSDELRRSAAAPTPRHVKWAIEYMQEHVAEAISLSDIALHAKVSIRSLQVGFRQFKNTSPMAYLHEIRMAAAHQDLLRDQTEHKVSDIATRWGFRHLGRFAADYQRRFGCLPSQTLGSQARRLHITETKTSNRLANSANGR